MRGHLRFPPAAAAILSPAPGSESNNGPSGCCANSRRITDTAQGTIRSLEATVQGFEERATKPEADIADANKRGKEHESKVGAPFEHEERYQHLSGRQSEIEEKLDITKNQAPSQVEASANENEEKSSKKQDKKIAVRTKQRMKVRV